MTSPTLILLVLERTSVISSPAVHENYLETMLKIQVSDLVDLEKGLGISCIVLLTIANAS